MSTDRLDLEKIRNRRVEQAPGRRLARRRSPDGPVEAIGEVEHRTDRLFVIRESSEYDFELLAKMLEQTLAPFRDESVRQALAIGVEPLRTTKRAEELREQIRAREFYAQDSPRQRIGISYAIGDDRFVLLLASAGKKTISGENEVTTLLQDLVEECRPRELVTGPISRIARTKANAAKLAESLCTYRTLVRSQGAAQVMDLTEVSGAMMWDSMVGLAQADYYATLQRLLTGVVMELRNGRYPHAAVHLPRGYRKRVVDGRPTHEVEPDPSQTEIVRSLIELGASDLTLSEIAVELVDRHQVRVRSTQYSTRPAPLITEARQPESAVRTLFGALPVYLDGTYRYSHEVTIPYLDDLFGIPVHRWSPEDNGYIVVDLNFGLPEGGWHDRDVIEEAIERRLGERIKIPRNKERVRPFAGLIGWYDDEHEYRLSTEDDRYCLRRRPLADAHDKSGRPCAFDSYDGEIIGSFLDEEVHRLAADALESIADGVITDIPCPHHDQPDDNELSELSRRLEEASAAADTARNEVTLATDETARDHYRDLAERHQATAASLAAELSQARRAVDLTNLRVDVSRIAEVIVNIRQADPFTSRDTHHSIRRLLRNLRIRAEASDPIATMSFEVETLTNQGPVTLGPISFTIPNHAVGTGPDAKRWGPAFKQRREMLLRYVLLEEATDADRLTLMASFPSKQRKWHEAAFKLLRDRLPTDAAISALLDCPILGVRRAVLGPILESDAPHGLADDFADEVRRLYLDQNFEWTKSWCPGGMDTRRRILHFIDRYDKGNGVPFESIRDHLGTNEPLAYALIGSRVDATKYSVSSVGSHALLDDVTGWYHSGLKVKGIERPVRVRQCPHCGERKLIQPLKVPEVAGQVLCVACRRDPASDLVYPDEYFVPWDGPQSPARRSGRAPLFNRYEGFFIDDDLRGTHPYEPQVPSINSPRRKKSS